MIRDLLDKCLRLRRSNVHFGNIENSRFLPLALGFDSLGINIPVALYQSDLQAIFEPNHPTLSWVIVITDRRTDGQTNPTKSLLTDALLEFAHFTQNDFTYKGCTNTLCTNLKFNLLICIVHIWMSEPF